MNRLFVFLFTYYVAINAFNPISTPDSDSPLSATHESITRCAVATITCEYIQSYFGVQTLIPTVTNGICPSSVFTDIKNLFSQIQDQGAASYISWTTTLDYIVARNALVDVTEQTDESRHFDSESFIAASKIILQRYQSAIDSLNKLDYENANEYFGKMMHTLQDFYSHSNWIELNNRQPQADLGINVMNSIQFAGPTVRTCTNCLTGDTLVCQSNNDISKGLTSGYFLLLADIFHKKPGGKCSHGGTFDATKNNDAIGGINKDTLLSIHGYLHELAAQTAYLATCKILRQFRSKVPASAFGRFLNILDRDGSSTRSLLLSVLSKINIDSAFLYTITLNNIRTVNSFSLLQETVSLPAIDSYYKPHLLFIARQKYITINIFRNSIIRSNSFDFGQDLARITGGVYVSDYNKSQTIISTNKQNELIDILYSKNTSENISITIDSTCSSLLLEFLTNETIPPFTIQLNSSNRILSPSSIVIDATYYRSYLFSNISPGTWKLMFSSSVKFTFNLRISCTSGFRCFSRMYVNNDNSAHPGLVELEGNLIQSHNSVLRTTCDDNNDVTLKNISVTMVDESNGNILGSPFQSRYNSENGYWITNLINIPSKSFRLKFLINNRQIQRLSRLLYQPSLIDVEIIQVQITDTNQTLVKYRLFNYYQQSIKISFVAKNIGTYIQMKDYTLTARETRDDQLEFDATTKANDMINSMLALTVSTSDGDWNYDIISI